MTQGTLYRKYRSQGFSELVGQEVIRTVLLNALKAGEASHAYLLSGPRGTGKTSTARILAKALNCEQPMQGEPCNRCRLCQKITVGQCVDVLEVDAASNRGIDEIRNLREQLHFQPMEGRCKVYIIDEVHMLTDAAFNALLKTLEEPPAHVYFCLATTDAQKVPVTISSRCQRLYFRKITAADIVLHLQAVLQKEGRQAESEALDMLSQAADGGLRDALSLLEQALTVTEKNIQAADIRRLLGVPAAAAAQAMLTQAVAGNLSQAYASLAELLGQGVQAAELLKQWVVQLTQALQHAGHNKSGEQAQHFSLAQALTLLDVCFDIDKRLRWHEDKQLLLELTLAKFHVALQPASTAQYVVPSVQDAVQSAQVKEKVKEEVKVKVEGLVSGNPSLAEIKHRWKDVLSAVRQVKMRIYMLLCEAEPVAVDQSTLWLAYHSGNSFLKEQIKEPEHMAVVEQAIERVMGQKLKLKPVMQGEAVGAAPPVEQTGEKAPVEADDHSAQRILEVFNGKFV